MPAKTPKKTPASKARKPAKPKTVAKSAAKTARPAKAPRIDNKARYLEFVDQVLNAGNFAVAADFLTPDVNSHNGFPGQEPGAPGFIAALKAFHGAFPDLHVNVTHAVAEADLVVGRFEVTGTHRGSFLGSAPTGRKVHYQEIAIVRMSEGRVAEHWSVADALAILQQLQASEIT